MHGPLQKGRVLASGLWFSDQLLSTGRNRARNRQLSKISDQYSCLVCPYTSNSKDNIRQHVQIHSDKKTVSSTKRIQKRFSCSYCPFKSFSQHAITQHTKSHSDFRYKCYSCKQQFHLKTELTEHLKTHKSSEVYKCDICSQEFTLINVLTAHRKSHIQSKSFTCQYCQKVFCDVVVFNQHVNLHQDTDHKVKVKNK